MQTDQAVHRGLMLTAARMWVIILVTCVKLSLTDFRFLAGMSIFVEDANWASADTNTSSWSQILLWRLACDLMVRDCTERFPFAIPCNVAQA